MNEEAKFEFTPKENAVRWRLEEYYSAMEARKEAYKLFEQANTREDVCKAAMEEAFETLRKERE